MREGSSWSRAGLALAAVLSGVLAGCDNGDRVDLVLEARGRGATTEARMDAARTVVAQRIEGLGASFDSIDREGPLRIIVKRVSRGDVEAIKAVVGRRGRLQFRLVGNDVRPNRREATPVPPGYERLPMRDSPGEQLLVERRTIIDGGMIAGARPDFNEAGEPTVAIEFNEVGSGQFAQVTRENVTRRFAIVVDDEIVSAPFINEPVEGPYASISGGFTVEEANALALVLRSGPLPVTFDVIEVRAPPP